MSTLTWIIVTGTAMCAVALVGGFALLLPERVFDRIVPLLVALAAGSLLGGAFFHMLPAAVAAGQNRFSIYVALSVGFLSFFVLEQFLHWHHCHKSPSRHRPLGYMILVADAGHNFIGGLAVGAAFVVDVGLGITVWIAAVAHEIPQELGDFGILVNSGWRRRSALAYNLASALTFPVGALVTYWLAGGFSVELLLAFGAGNFIYIAAADLIPEMSSQTRTVDKFAQTLVLTAGLALLLLLALI